MFNLDKRETLRSVGLFLGKDGSMSAVRTIMGVAMGALIGTGVATSAVPLVAMGAGFVGFTGAAHWAIERGRKEELLDTYRTEISHMLGKDEKQLALGDLDLVARSYKNSKGSTALRMGMDYFKDVRNFFITSQAVTAAIMIVALVSAAPYLSGVMALSSVALAGGSGFVYNRMFRTVENIHSFVTRKDVRDDIINDIETIQHQVALGGRVSTTRVLGVLVEADPILQKAVQGEFHQTYPNLSIAEKRKAVKLLGEKTQVVGLTREINIGRILPTELAFIAFGENSGTPKDEVTPEIHMVRDDADDKRWTAHISTPEETYTKQLDVDNQKLLDTSPTVH